MQPALDRTLHALSRHRALSIFLILVLTAAFAAGLFDRHTGAWKLKVDPAVSRLLPANDEGSQFYERVRKTFGGEDTILVAVETANVFTPDNIRRVARISNNLSELPEVHHVLSLATAPNLRAGEESLDVSTVAEQIETDPAMAGKLREDVLANPLYSGNLVSKDGRTAAIVVYLKETSGEEFIDKDIAGSIKRIAESDRGDAKIWVTGTPVITAETTRALLRELQIAIPGIALIAVVFLFLVFRSPSAVILPLITIVLALTWTLGTLAWLGRPLNLVTSIVPPLIITMGLAYSMHVLAEYSSVLSEQPEGQRAGVDHVLASLVLPLSITSLTTITGFLALLPSSLAATREFAWLSALGVFYTWMLAMLFLPAALSFVGPRAGRMKVTSVQIFRRMASRLAQFDMGARRNILIVGAGFVLVALVGAAQIKSGTDFIGDFRKDAPVRVDYDAVSKAFGGANNFYIVIDGGVPDAITDPEALKAIQSLQEWLAEQPEIAKTTSIADHLLLIQRGFAEAGEKVDALPTDQKLIKQLLVFGGGNEISSVADRSFRTANILVRTNVGDTRSLAELLRRIEPHLQSLPEPLKGRVTGNAVLIARALTNIARGQLASIALAMTIIFLIMAALFTSYRAAFLGLLPNILPIAIYFGLLGFTGVTLNPTTSLIATIVLGIAADDTIHYFVRFNTDARRSANEQTAAFHALEQTLRPITYTATALCLGFLVLTTSELRNQVQFGLLASFTLVAAWLANIILTPALASGVRIVTLWDVLRLDLGRDPQTSIPLMSDLNLRQSRIFALLSNVMDLKAGQRLLTEGDEGDDMYVVISGTLRVWVQRADGPVDLATMERGSVLGEVGYFMHKRTANVDALTDVRLLAFNEQSLERLRRWRPWIAAVVYRNLNRVQAERMARTTGRMR